MTTQEQFLKEYDIHDFERPSLTTDIACFRIAEDDGDNYRKNPQKKLMLLLVRRKEHPFKDAWALPGGFLQPSETIEQCALREIYEETAITPVSLMPVSVFSDPGRDPRGWIISNAYASIISQEDVQAVGGDDAADAKWFEVSFTETGENRCCLRLTHGDICLQAKLEQVQTLFGISHYNILENTALAFDHAKIIATSLSAIRARAKDFEYLFDFLPETFTLSALQKVQETIMNIEILPANFRRKVAGYVEQTDAYTTGAGHRPAQLYKKKSR